MTTFFSCTKTFAIFAPCALIFSAAGCNVPGQAGSQEDIGRARLAAAAEDVGEDGGAQNLLTGPWEFSGTDVTPASGGSATPFTINGNVIAFDFGGYYNLDSGSGAPLQYTFEQPVSLVQGATYQLTVSGSGFSDPQPVAISASLSGAGPAQGSVQLASWDPTTSTMWGSFTVSSDPGPTPVVTLNVMPAIGAVGPSSGTTTGILIESYNITASLIETQQPLPPGDVYAVNSGGGALGGYTADQDYITVGGGVYATSQPIYFTQAAVAPAPAGVYSDARQGGHFRYVFPGLLPSHTYAVILHFAELYWSEPGQREFNVAINGKAVLTDFDMVASGGGRCAAVDQFFFPYSDANGTIEIDFSRGAVDQPSVNGIEIRADND